MALRRRTEYEEPKTTLPGAGPAGCSGGYLGQQIKGTDGQWHLLARCRDNFQPRRAADGRIWCCPIYYQPPGGDKDGSENGGPMAKTLACVGGVCREVDVSTPENIAACRGKKVGDPCGTAQACESDTDCPAGFKCINGKCEPFEPSPPPPPDGDGGSPCPGGGGYHDDKSRMGICRDGFHIVPSKDKKTLWCCPDTDGDGKEAGSPCEGSGYLGKQIKGPDGTWRLLEPCRAGHVAKKAEDGRIWCCGVGEKPCASDADCPGGKKCVDGQCVEPDAEGCEGGYVLTGGESSCREGFFWKKYGETVWCCPEGTPGLCTSDDDCPEGQECDKVTGACVDIQDGDGGDGGGDGGIGGMFGWSPELQGLISRIMERANYLLDYPRGLTPAERQTIINYAIEGVKKSEPGRLQASRDQLARMGLLGSGFELTEAGKIRRETREMAADVRRELAIDELNRRFSELMGTTGMVGDLGQFLLTTEQIPEVLSAARRTEGYATTNALLNYLGQLSAGAGSFAPYWQAIISQLAGGQAGGAGGNIWDWLPWLSFYLEGGGSGLRRV